MKRRPGDSDFKQQRMAAWKPVFRDRWVLGLLLLTGVTFLAVGVPMLVGSNGVQEFSYDYTHCVDKVTQADCSVLLSNYSNGYTNNANTAMFAQCQCVIPISLSGFGSSGPALFYGLSNYYQNHRLFTSSVWNPQLRSDSIGGGPDCDRFQTEPSTGKPYAPCGQLANAMFNDTIRLYHYSGGALQQAVGLSGYHISWADDRNHKYRNPTSITPLCNYSLFSPAAVAKPINWPIHACELGADVASPRYNPWSPTFNSSGLGYENEDFIVWMRVAGSLGRRV